jgi:hypothetical protein
MSGVGTVGWCFKYRFKNTALLRYTVIIYANAMYDFKPFTPIGKTNWRNHNQLFGIKPADKLHHIYCLGKTGTGKSTLLINMALDDIFKGYGVCVLDPHSDTATAILQRYLHIVRMILFISMLLT